MSSYSKTSDTSKAKFIEFMKERGDDQVSNPNPKSRDRYPKVKVKSLSSSPEGQELVKKMFKDWVQSQKEKEKSKSIFDEMMAEIQQEKEERARKLKQNRPTLKENPAPSKPFFGISSKDIDSFIQDHKEVFQEYLDVRKSKSVEEIVETYDKHFSETKKFPVPETSVDQKKLEVLGTSYGSKVSEILTKESPEYPYLLGGEGGWVFNSGKDASAMLQGVLSRMGVKGHINFQETQASGEDKGVEDKLAREFYEESKKSKDYSRKFNQVSISSEKIEKIVKQMYVATQAFFKSEGITHVTVYRGVRKQIEGEPPKVGDTISIKSRELSSWSTDPNVGSSFGRVIAAKVPVEQILGGFITDPVYGNVNSSKHSFGESELMVLESSEIEATVISD